ncbi:MAG: LptF/LptG family permease [Hoylesella saccharolytica]|uniref:LptF/LptG family permease n=1 Tax=Hoylesella saccharolytica TaxID=633701 RepID=UPI000472F7E5|nr:LptF/LptG family permease [Hoylesella saccharolytica]
MFRIKKLDIFIAKQFGMLFFGTFFICQFVVMMQYVWRSIDELIGKGLSMEILAQFFWYLGLMMVPQALPLAILLSSLITFGNLGESSELTAIKASGISLMQSFRSLIVITVLICLGSFYFQNQVGQHATLKIAQLLWSMKQKSPELEIPEGVFYNGIPKTNIYVQKKDTETGKLYGIMIYRIANSYEDSEIILADSGRLQTTADKKHLLLSLWSGEWFTNQSQEVGSNAAVPFRRETFLSKTTLIDFDSDFSITDAALLAGDARGKGLSQIYKDLDSLNHQYDSIGRTYYREMQATYYDRGPLNKADSLQAVKLAASDKLNFDTLYARLSSDKKKDAVSIARSQVQSLLSDLEFKTMITDDGNKMIRQHQIEAVNKFLLSLLCLIFFFIGAPLGSIIRKGGLGIPVIVSVLVFIVYYILDNSGYQMSRRGIWTVWFGRSLAPGVLVPVAIFVTYKANKDSVVFNLDAYRHFFRKFLGLRIKRNISGKEVIINEPDYRRDADLLAEMSQQIATYSQEHRLTSAPNVFKVFFKYQPDHVIERLDEQLEAIIEDLGNTKDKVIMTELNNYPVLSNKAHTRPFDRQWMNAVAAAVVPVGLFLYFRMWRFRLRLHRDLKVIRQTNEVVIDRINSITNG